MTAAYEAAIVDLDGTMVDTLGDFDAVLNIVLRELGLPAVGRAFLSHTIGKGSEHLIRSTLAEVGADAALYEPAWALYQHGEYSEAQRYSKLALQLGTRDAAMHYRAGMIALALNDRSGAREQLRQALAINPYFSARCYFAAWSSSASFCRADWA